MEKKYSRKTLSALFLKQLTTIESRGASRNLLYHFRSQRDEVLQKAESLLFAKGDVPFLPVIPFTHRSYFDQMPMIEIDGKKGTNSNCQDCCIWNNTYYFHRKPWYIFKVNAGDPLQGESIDSYSGKLNSKGLRSLLPEEVISLCLHTQPKDVSLYCRVPHSNPWSQTHLMIGEIPNAGLESGLPGYGPTMYGLIGNLSSKRNYLRVPSCVI